MRGGYESGNELFVNLESGWVGQVLRLLLHVLVLHALHVQLLLPSVDAKFKIETPILF